MDEVLGVLYRERSYVRWGSRVQLYGSDPEGCSGYSATAQCFIAIGLGLACLFDVIGTVVHEVAHHYTSFRGHTGWGK